MERDPLGEHPVPADAYYGIQTQRAAENFPISGLRAPTSSITATILIKKAAAAANMATGTLLADIGRAIIAAADEVLAGTAPRSVHRRRLPGRRRHLAQHERQRGAGEPRGGNARRARRARTQGSSERSRQHVAVDERRVPGGDAPRTAAGSRPARGQRARAAGGARRKVAANLRRC